MTLYQTTHAFENNQTSIRKSHSNSTLPKPVRFSISILSTSSFDSCFHTFIDLISATHPPPYQCQATAQKKSTYSTPASREKARTQPLPLLTSIRIFCGACLLHYRKNWLVLLRTAHSIHVNMQQIKVSLITSISTFVSAI